MTWPSCSKGRSRVSGIIWPLWGAVDWLDHEPSLRGAEIADELLVREL